MKKIQLLLLPIILCFGFYARAQDGEVLVTPKGLSIQHPAPFKFQTYTVKQQLFNITGADDLVGWTNDRWQLGADGLGTGAYPSNASYALISPAIQLPAVRAATDRIYLYLEEWYELESYYDIGLIQLSIDDGATWQTVSAREGSASLRTTRVNLSAYAGELVKIALRLQTDDTYEFKGWYINKMYLQQEEAPSLLSSQIKLSTPGGINARTQAALTGQIVGVDAQRFPRYIYTSVKVEDGGSTVLGLDEANFFVREFINYGSTTADDTLSVPRDDDHFRVYAPAVDSIQKPVDIVFLMDNSGSMANDIAAVANNVESFLDQLEALGFDYRLGLCRFGMTNGVDDIESGRPVFHQNARFYSDAAEFLNVWNTVNVANGGFEPSWDALYESTTEYSFRSGAQKIFILITDEAIVDYNYTYSIIKDQQTVIDKLNATGVTTYALTYRMADFVRDFDPITAATGGRSFPLNSNFNDILTEIGNQIDGTYVIRYAPTDPAFNGIPRDVEVTVNYDGSELVLREDEAYTPGAQPILVRTDETLALHETGQLNSVAIDISVRSIDWDVAPYTTSVTLYYRALGSTGAYKSIAMSQSDFVLGSPTPPTTTVTSPTTAIWTATIPAADVLEPGIQYYFRAADADVTITYPEFIDRPGFPFAFAVLPNMPPVLNHTPLEAIDDVKTDIVFTAEAIDTTYAIAHVYLYYKKEADINYTLQEMTLVPGTDTYTYTLPALNETGILSYYIVAIDDLGAVTHSGYDTDPHTVPIGEPWSSNTSAYVHTVRFFPAGPYAATVTIDDVGVSSGDIIGAFYVDGAGMEQTVGRLVWPQQAITIYGDDPNSAEVEGVAEGTPFYFKIYSNTEKKIYTVYVTELYSVGPSTDLTFTRNGLSFVKSLKAYSNQSIYLPPGVNLVASYLSPIAPDFADLVSDIAGSVTEVADSDGTTYSPAGGGALSYTTGYGYRFDMGNAATLLVVGPKMEPTSTTVQLSDLGTMIGCPYAAPEDVESVFIPYDPNVYIVDKYVNDGSGGVTIETYSPTWDINGWTNKNMRPGEAYYVYVFSPQNFTFPAASGAHTARMASDRSVAPGSAQTITSIDHYMHVLIPADSWADLPADGSELRVYNAQNNLVGKATVKSDGTIVTIDGTRLGGNAKFSLRLWQPQENAEAQVYVSEWQVGSSWYQNHTAAVVGKLSTRASDADHTALTVFPNPVRQDEATIYFSLTEEQNISIELIDGQLGRSVGTIAQGLYPKGEHRVTFQKRALARGLYFVKLNTGQAFEVKKMVVE